MRKIKFRAWDKEEHEMIDGDSWFFGQDELEPFIDTVERAYEYYDLMQYIGLRDKNGKEGYFSDLVKWGKAVYEIVWNEDDGIAIMRYIKGKEIFKYLRIEQIKQGEVIGNIYENPELTERQE